MLTFEANTYYDWVFRHAYLAVPAQDYVGKFLMTFNDYRSPNRF